MSEWCHLRRTWGISGVIVVAAVPAVHAHDLFPAPFRGQPGTTLQCWEFDTPDVNKPDCCLQASNPFGPTPANTSGTWACDYAGQSGILCLQPGQTFDAIVPNVFMPNVPKFVWIQVTWHPHNIGGLPGEIGVDVGVPGAVVISQTDVSVPGADPAWIHRTYVVFLPICPPDEPVRVIATVGSIDIDQLFIETVCGEVPGVPPQFPDPDDFDGDGIKNDVDNCPYIVNPAQADQDGDGVGDECDCDPCPGDVNRDATVNDADLGLLLSVFGSKADDPAFLPKADFNGDCVIDDSDLGILLANYLLPCP